ncbi:MAG: gliding motility protein GldN [Bacteroidota bacterium]
MRNVVKIVCVGLISSSSVFAQETDVQYNPNSVDPIPKYEQLYKVRVWRQIDLSEKQNKGFFANNGQITKLILDAIRSGEIADVYDNDSLRTKLSKDNFLKLLTAAQGTVYPNWDPTTAVFSGDVFTYNGKNYEAQTNNTGLNPESSPNDWVITSQGRAQTYLASDISTMRIVEDMIFDKRRSRLYYDIQAVQLVVPGSKTTTGVDTELGWIKYKDLVKVFRNHPDEAIWFNRYNTAENKNYADAFLLRLFHGNIYKVENPDDNRIVDIYPMHKEAIWATEWEEMKMMEREHNLWEY